MLTNREQYDAIIEPAFPAIALLRVTFRFCFLRGLSCGSRGIPARNRELLSRFIYFFWSRLQNALERESSGPKTLISLFILG